MPTCLLMPACWTWASWQQPWIAFQATPDNIVNKQGDIEAVARRIDSWKFHYWSCRISAFCQIDHKYRHFCLFFMSFGVLELSQINNFNNIIHFDELQLLLENFIMIYTCATWEFLSTHAWGDCYKIWCRQKITVLSFPSKLKFDSAQLNLTCVSRDQNSWVLLKAPDDMLKLVESASTAQELKDDYKITLKNNKHE